MRVRVVQHPTGKCWMVELKHSWFTGWSRGEMFCGDEARERAIAYAKLLINPEIIEVSK